VRAENVAHGSDQQMCSTGRLAVMITGQVPPVRVSPIIQLAGSLRLSWRDETWKTVEILILRHQLR
jgi:hypothetical protein